MTDEDKKRCDEIRERCEGASQTVDPEERAAENIRNFLPHARSDVRYLLDLVERMEDELLAGDVIVRVLQEQNARLRSALENAIEMMDECAADEHCGGENLLDNIAKARAALGEDPDGL